VSRLIDAIGQDVRSTDLIGRTDTGLALALLDADAAGLAHVIDRLAALIERHRQTFPIRVTVSAACYPGHGLDASSLWEHAASNVLMRVGRRRAARRDQASR
jgi:hypothetical protein